MISLRSSFGALMPGYGTEMTVTDNDTLLTCGSTVMAYYQHFLSGELVMVNIAIRTLSDGLHLLSIHGIGAKRKRPNVRPLRFPATIRNTKLKPTPPRRLKRGLAYST